MTLYIISINKIKIIQKNIMGNSSKKIPGTLHCILKIYILLLILLSSLILRGIGLDNLIIKEIFKLLYLRSH